MRKVKPEGSQVFITWHSTSQVLLMRSLLRRKEASGFPSSGCETGWLIHGVRPEVAFKSLITFKDS